MTDAEGLTTTYTYDALGRTICETRPGFRGALLITSNEGELVAPETERKSPDVNASFVR